MQEIKDAIKVKLKKQEEIVLFIADLEDEIQDWTDQHDKLEKEIINLENSLKSSDNVCLPRLAEEIIKCSNYKLGGSDLTAVDNVLRGEELSPYQFSRFQILARECLFQVIK